MMRFLRWFRSQEAGVRAALIGLVGTLTAALITATVTLTIALNRPPGGNGPAPAPTSSLTPTASDTPAPGPTTTAPHPEPTDPSTTPPPSPTRSTRPPTSQAPPAPQSRVRWHGTLELDGDTMTRGWWLDQVPPGSAVNGDVYTEGSSALYSDAALAAWTGSGTPTHDACASLLDTNPGQHVLDVQVGDLACIGTWDKRVGYVEVIAIPDAERIKVSATVWQRE
jgi:hypothetical protein